MKKKIPHDALVKRMLSEPGFPEAFFDTLLPARLKQCIRWESLRIAKTNFVDDELRQHFSDAFFEVEVSLSSGVNQMEIALLVEHKSNEDDFVILQVLRYMIQAFLHQAKQQEKQKKKGSEASLTPIFPVVIYHGGTDWQAKSFKELFGIRFEEIGELFINLPMMFHNISSKPVEEILAIEYNIVKATLLTQKYSHDPRSLFMSLGVISEIIGDGNEASSLIVYIFKILSSEYTKEEIIQQINTDMEPTFKSFYDKLIEEGMEKGIEKGREEGREVGREEGIAKGIEKGMEKGIYLEKANTIRRMYGAGFDLEQIAVLVEWSVEEVRAVLSAEA